MKLHSVAADYGALACSCRTGDTSARAWRPLPKAVADVVCVQRTANAIPSQTHEFLSITLVLGSATLRSPSGGDVLLRPGDLVIVPPGEVMMMEAGRSQHLDVQTLLVAPESICVKGADQRTLISAREVSREFAALFANFQRPLRALQCVDALRSLVAVVGQYADGSHRVTHAPALVIVRDYLRAQLGARLSVAELARRGGMSAYHFVRTFHREFGLPPHAYHMCARLARAARLLSAGRGISAVAYETGFADQSHLTRKFKQTYGTTPGVWARATAPPDATTTTTTMTTNGSIGA